MGVRVPPSAPVGPPVRQTGGPSSCTADSLLEVLATSGSKRSDPVSSVRSKLGARNRRGQATRNRSCAAGANKDDRAGASTHAASPFQDHVRQRRTALLVESFNATFRVTPSREGGVDQPEHQASAAASGSADTDQRKLVLVVEDDESVSGLLIALLEERGYEAIAALDGQTAIELARKRHPHLITLDLALPGSDGHDVLAGLKADPRTSDIPIVVISAFTQILPAGERKKLAYLLGKPFDVTEVLDIVQATVGNPYV